MANAELKIDERRQRILEYLRRDGQVRVKQLSELLGTTVVTIRSDLANLERDGYLERTQGGAVQSTKNFYNMDFQHRKQEHMAEKKQIAVLAADMIHDGDTLMINSGTTTYFTASELKRYRNLNIVTNSLMVAVELGAVPTFRVILLGGEINAQYAFTYGEDVRRQLTRYKADYAILSMDGVDEACGVTTYHAEESMVDRIMMERAGSTIIVADSSKFGHESFSQVCTLEQIDYWITDNNADPAQLAGIRSNGVVIIMP